MIPYRLIVISKHRLLREYLAESFADCAHFSETVQLDDVQDVPRWCHDATPVLVLLDLGIAVDRLLSRVHELLGRWSQVRLIVLGVPGDDQEIVACFEAGVHGYVLKDAGFEELESVVEQVIDGKAGCSPRVASVLFARLAALAREHRIYERARAWELTQRELEILELIAGGLSNKQIADNLCLSVYTVKNHVHRLLSKLEVRDRGAAVREAHRRRWLPELS